MKPGMFRGKVSALLNFRVLTKTISRLCRKKKRNSRALWATSLLFSGSCYGEMLDFGLFSMERDDQRLLGSCVSALGEAGPSAFPPHLYCQEEEGVNESPLWYMIPGVGEAGRAHVS